MILESTAKIKNLDIKNQNDNLELKILIFTL